MMESCCVVQSRAEQSVEEGGGYKGNRDTVGEGDLKSLTTGAEKAHFC